ncbi:hypothetical protein Glove_103g166 [Diversispora epigaea]|uniref:Uncharacterized protein n=1 Tax=Diversispora epigaea TaxID=1348612 RepID=A0A397JE40_9GLOM|nr:hypothetical protein Glove_103g166 [Diversispora epigaea]
MKEMVDILVHHNIRSTNLNLHKEINTLSLNKEDYEEEDEKFFINKNNINKIYNDDISNAYCDQFIERMKDNQPISHRSWILQSDTNVKNKLDKYSYILEHYRFEQKYINKVLFSKKDWDEINESVKKDIKLVSSYISDIVEYFFNEVEKVAPVSEVDFDNSFSNMLAKRFLDRNKLKMDVIKNLYNLEAPVSEVDFDNSFSNMLAKRFLDRNKLKMDV